MPDMNALPKTLTEAAATVLDTPHEKVALTFLYSRLWRDGGLSDIGTPQLRERPARPEKPQLLSPGKMPKRKASGSLENRTALLHALAHIELNAIDLAWDIIARFPQHFSQKAFYDDWVQVADDEARHFESLENRLKSWDSHYGALPAHDGLWQAAQETSDDPMARLALVPMLLEARGLDVTPTTVEKIRHSQDHETADLLHQIFLDEISHVAIGTKWFKYLASERKIDPISTWQDLVKQRFKGDLKPPFNDEARQKAGMEADFYQNFEKAR